MINITQWPAERSYCLITVVAKKWIKEFARRHLANLEEIGTVTIYEKEKQFDEELDRWISKRYYLENEAQAMYLETAEDINYWIAPKKYWRKL